MTFGEAIKSIIGIEKEVDDPDVTEEEVNKAKSRLEADTAQIRTAQPAAERAPVSQPSPVPRAQPGRFATTGATEFKLLLINPKTFQDCPKLVDSLKSRRPVIVNLEQLETEVARQIFDFLSGATYALSGNVQKISSNIFVFAPPNVDIAGGQFDNTGTVEYDGDRSSGSDAGSGGGIGW